MNPRAIVPAAGLLILAACTTEPNRPAPSSVTISASVTVAEADSIRLAPVFRDADGRPLTGVTVHWSVLDSSRATVDSTGLVRFVRPGSTTVTLTADTIVRSVEVHTTVAFTAFAAGGLYSAFCGASTAGNIYCGGTDSLQRLQFGPTPIARIVSGGQHQCAIATDGRAFCWGSNFYGERGTEDSVSTVTSSIPRPVLGGLSFARLAAGPEHTCGITAAGAAYCWGGSRHGALGDGDSTWHVVTQPQPVAGARTYIDIAAGDNHTCAVATDGTAWCWGWDYNGALGTGPAGAAHNWIPGQVAAPGIAFTTITAGANFTCALAQSGAAWCWGDNSVGQLATTGGAGVYSASPTLLPVGPFGEIGAGYMSTCATSQGTGASCWGGGPFDADWSGLSSTPVTPVPGGQAFTQLSKGARSACARGSDDAVWCWGGDFGTTPRRVVDQP